MMTYSQRERRKTKKRKADAAAAANHIAAANAHVAQVNRHVEVVQARSAQLDADGKRLAALLEDRDCTIRRQSADITLFKQEALEAAIREAELRGYISRVLEDDAVREPSPPSLQPGELPNAERSHMQQLLAYDQRARSQPPAPRRTGPSAMRPLIIMDSNPTTEDPWRNYRHGTPVIAAQEQKHWMDR